MPILETKNLTYVYGEGTPFRITAVEDVNISVEKGEFVGIIGHTGSGKSTLVQHLNGLLKPTSGSILLNGEDIHKNKETTRAARFKVGLCFQYPEYQLFESTVYRDIAFGPKNMGLSEAQIKEAVLRAADFVGIRKEWMEKSPFDLSGGEKRRVAIAGVMAMEPEILILDEPTAGMDALSRRQMWNLLHKLNERELTILLTTHYMEEAQSLCDRLAMMNHGKLEEVNTSAGFIAHLGAFTVDQMTESGIKSHYFHERKDALAFLERMDGRFTLRETTLEDVFVERCGGHLMVR